jgi:hypothetical protein
MYGSDYLMQTEAALRQQAILAEVARDQLAALGRTQPPLRTVLATLLRGLANRLDAPAPAAAERRLGHSW